MDYKERSLFLEERIKRLNEIGIALSTESNTNKLTPKSTKSTKSTKSVFFNK